MYQRNLSRLAFWIAFAVSPFVYASPYTAYAAETIPSFDARISVNQNGTIEVEERIVYDFGTAKQHGIFRTIPYSYQAGSETYTASVSSVIVSDGAGNPLPFNESRGNGELTIKIGDPNKTVTGMQTYTLSYVVSGPFLYFDDFDELYWNVTGVWSKNTIEKASVLVDLPVGASVLTASCYQGAPGSPSACSHDQKLVSAERAGYQAEAITLAPGEGFTIAVSFPKGTIAQVEDLWNTSPLSPFRYAPFVIPLIVLAGMLRLWYVKGRDPLGSGTIITQFEPPKGVPPAIAGTLYNEQVEQREISAEIVRLATEGYLKIHRLDEKVLLIIPKTDYLLERAQPEKNPGDAIAALLLDTLFQGDFMGTKEINGRSVHGVLLSKMQHKFVKENKVIQERLYDEVVARGYFPASPQRTRVVWSGIGIAVVVGGFFFLPSVLGVAILTSGIIIAIVGWFMPVKTREGVRVREYLEGFKHYLEVAEKDRIAFHNAPHKTPALFDAFLPYAIMFGVEKEWATQFEGIYTQEPTWYSGSTAQAFAASALVSDLNTFSSTVAAASAPQSSGASGGGSVGGGFGGGGGGSW